MPEVEHNNLYTTINGQIIRTLKVHDTLLWVVQHVKSGEIILNGVVPFTTKALAQLLSETVRFSD